MQNLDQAAALFFTPITLIFCLGCFVVTYVLRTATEAIHDSMYHKPFTNVLWTELFLPLGPILVGWVLAILAKKFPFPVVVGGSIMAKLLYGGICGLFSGWMYSRVRSFLQRGQNGAPGSNPFKLPESPQGENLPPAPTDKP